MDVAIDQDQIGCEGFAEFADVPDMLFDQDAIGAEGFSDVPGFSVGMPDPPADPPVPPSTPAASPVSRAVVSYDLTTARGANRKTQTLERTCRRHKAQLTELKQQMKQLTQKPSQHQRVRKNYLVALARNSAHGSCQSASVWSSLLDGGSAKPEGSKPTGVSKWTVARWEQSTQTCILSDSQKFYIDCEQDFMLAGCDNVTAVAIHTLCGDATKARAWKEDKLQVLELTSKYVLPSGIFCKTIWPDLQVVHRGDTDECWSIVHRQCRIAGAPCLDVEVASSMLPSQIRIINSCGDCGPDQCGFRNRLQAKYKPHVHVWVALVPCVPHQTSICYVNVVSMSDKIMLAFYLDPYYSSLVKMNHLWRKFHWLVQKVVRQRFKANSPQAKAASKKPTQCVTGKWGYLTNVETHYLQFTEADLRQINSDAFFFNYLEEDAKAEAVERAEGARAARLPHDDIRIDEIKAHKEKESRFRREARAAVSKHEFHLMMRVSHKATLPLDHLLNFFQSNDYERHLFTLVTTKSSQLLTEFETILLDPQWIEECHEDNLVNIFPDQAYCMIVSMVCCGAAEYDARVVKAIATQFPFLLLFMVLNPPDVFCVHRKRVSARMSFLLISIDDFMHCV